MSTSFSSLPIVDLSALSSSTGASPKELAALSKQLYNVFSTTGFAYLVNAPLSFKHNDIFTLARDFFSMETEEKMKLAKKSFSKQNSNTYRGYFPPQPGQIDNLKEGFEVGPSYISSRITHTATSSFNLAESNVWPSESSFQTGRSRLEDLYSELQSLSCTILSLLATSLGKPSDYFSSYLGDSLSTLRLLHYPAQNRPQSMSKEPALCCTPHTDSGILTLLHQDPTGGLEVLNSSKQWIPAPYVPGSIVVNIGDLMAKVSGGRFVATMHRVRTSTWSGRADGMGRFSVPFFFEPGENCIIRSVDDEAGVDGVVYGEHVREKMGGWVEFQDAEDEMLTDRFDMAGKAVEAY